MRSGTTASEMDASMLSRSCCLAAARHDTKLGSPPADVACGLIRQIPHSCKWPQVKLRKSIFIPPTTSNSSHEPWRFKILFKKIGCFVHRLGFSPFLTRAIPAVEFCPLPCIWPSTFSPARLVPRLFRENVNSLALQNKLSSRCRTP